MADVVAWARVPMKPAKVLRVVQVRTKLAVIAVDETLGRSERSDEDDGDCVGPKNIVGPVGRVKTCVTGAVGLRVECEMGTTVNENRFK